MNLFRKILYPFSLLYGLIISIRNIAFDKGWLVSNTFDIPVIAVGNLSVGGTGKSPMIEYLIRLFQTTHHVAVLSRGYGRNTKGFFLAKPGCSAKQVGDEPFQFYRKFENIVVAVDEKRARGINTLRQLKPDLNLILLDDAFQHRHVKAGFYILLTAFNDLYMDDFLLPTGGLREHTKGAERADLILISKCPEDLSDHDRSDIIKRIAPKKHQEVFFSSISYDPYVYNDNQRIPVNDLNQWQILLVTGIANPKPLETFLFNNDVNFAHMKFADHQFISEKELDKIADNFRSLKGENKLILTTEKDFVRSFLDIGLPIYYLPIKTTIMEGKNKLNEIIQNYVRKN